MKKHINPPEQIRGVTVTIHYPKSDKEMWGDYYGVTIDIACGDKRFHMAYGDSYHDKGLEKAKGFVDALKTLYGDKIPFLELRAADIDDF